MRYLVMLCSVGIGVVMALGGGACSPSIIKSVTEAEKAEIAAAAVAALVNAPKNACREGFVYIPAGVFVMGSENGYDDERPVRAIDTDAYCIAKAETTNAEYRKIIPGPHEVGEKGFNDSYQPIVKVVWNEADVYCKKNGGRLPTEAEWEKAARGPQGFEYATHSGTLNKKEANYDVDKTTVVCSYPKNGYGLCDMTGNVLEWTNDWYAADTYKLMEPKNPQGPREHLNHKVLRGGSILYMDEGHLRATSRHPWDIGYRSVDFGFRCVVPVLNTVK